MQTGLAISLAGHAAVILAALAGWPLSLPPAPPMPQAVNVSLVSPDALSGAAPPPAAPEVRDTLAALPPPPRPAPEQLPEAAPPEAPVEQAAPLPPPVDRVAPVPVPLPPEEVPEAAVLQPPTAPVPDPEPSAEPEREAGAPEAAADRIVTEAVETDDRPELAPDAVPRPPQRQPRPVPVPIESAEAVPPEPEPEAPAADESAIADALAEALAAPTPGPAAPQSLAPAGPPLSGAEQDGLRLAVGRCWNFGALSSAAAQVTVVVALEMQQDGRPIAGSLRLASWDGGDRAAAEQAYEVARRAILSCGSAGYPLPPEKFAQWREIEMTFNPERMRQR